MAQPRHRSPSRSPAPAKKVFKPKKRLGQNFLMDDEVCQHILDALQPQGRTVVEIGPGQGALTRGLLERTDIDLWAVEVDPRAVDWLQKAFPTMGDRLVAHDVLTLDWRFLPEPINVIGNFPYFISSQIFFKILSERQRVRSVLCMLQKEVAERIASPHGSRAYGILSVFLQTYYRIEILFDVPPEAFHPRPQVTSSVAHLVRNERDGLPCDETLFRSVVKQAFHSRRKMLRNTLKGWELDANEAMDALLNKRAEHLSVEDFIWLTQRIEERKKTNLPER